MTHMPARKSADGAVANLVRSGRKQPQRFRAGSSASTVPVIASAAKQSSVAVDCRLATLLAMTTARP